MATLVSTYQLPDGRTANTTDTRLAWRIVTDGSQTIMAEETTGQTRTLHTMIADDDPNAVAAAAPTRPFAPDQNVEVGELIRDGDLVYKVAQAHRTQADWAPARVPNLFNLLGDATAVASGEPLPWKQPGSTNPYMKGDRVIWTDGKVYESVIDNNVWSISAYPAGWEVVP